MGYHSIVVWHQALNILFRRCSSYLGKATLDSEKLNIGLVSAGLGHGEILCAMFYTVCSIPYEIQLFIGPRKKVLFC